MNELKQIYHTSHCGSTLLITLLKSSIDSYSEPLWTHDVFKKDINVEKYIEKYKNSVIKFPSGWCCISKKPKGKKIFLYRKLRHHLFKIINQQKDNYVDYYEDFFLKNIHPSLQEISFNSFEEKNIFLWANKVMWMLEEKDVKWVESNYFFKNKKETLNSVCDFFEIEKVTDFKLENIHSKSINMLHQESRLNDIEIDYSKKIVVYPTFGIIDDEICNTSSLICNLIPWINKNIAFIPNNLL
jgi:hypothetical protein